MAYFMVHLKIAQELLKSNSNIKDLEAFYKGTLAPDAIMFRQGCKRSEKSSTHFCVGDEGWGYYTNYDEWQNNLNSSLRNYAGKINPDFLFGYYAHVITDIATANTFWNPVRLKQDKEHINKYISDCNEIDSLLLESFESKEMVWALLKKPTEYFLPDLFKAEDLSILIDEMINDMYNNRKPKPNYEFKVITPSDMIEFIDTVVSKINNL